MANKQQKQLPHQQYYFFGRRWCLTLAPIFILFYYHCFLFNITYCDEVFLSNNNNIKNDNSNLNKSYSSAIKNYLSNNVPIIESIEKDKFNQPKHRHQLHRKLKKFFKQQSLMLKQNKSSRNKTNNIKLSWRNLSSHRKHPLMDEQYYFNDTLHIFDKLYPTIMIQQHSRRQRHHLNESQSKKRPNIIFILTDDQDIELGSMNYMPKTMKIMAQEGVQIKNAYSTTPMCCPSRSSILTGLYVHNHNVYTNGENCSSIQWQQTHERHTFATYLRDIGYRTAYFGKYLNEYNGSYIPPGWSDWSALIRNSRYYNYTLNVNGDKVRHGANYHLDYYPDLILNDSLQYLRYSKRFFPSKPYLIVLSFPSPHGPEDSAPQYQNLFLKEKSHRTLSWNYAPNVDKQWLLRNTPKMSYKHQEFTDFLNSKRLQTLQSVDEAVFQLFNELKSLGELEKTYMIYTSDHGYHLGQFGLVKGKAMPFEFDIRVPFFVRGPNVPKGQILKQIVLNIDIAPTLLDIAGLKIPAHMDGISFLPYIKQLTERSSPDSIESESPNHSKLIRRDSFLVERGKFKTFNNVDRLLIPIIGKKQWLQLQCLKPEYQSPCKPKQRFECFQNDQGIQRIRKCPSIHDLMIDDEHFIRSKMNSNGECICPMPLRNLNTNRNNNNKLQYRNNKHRLKKINSHKNWFKKNHLLLAQRRGRRSDNLTLTFHDESYVDFDVQGVYELKRLIEISKSSTGGGGSSFEPSNHLNNDNQSIKTTAQRMMINNNNNNNNNNLANITTSQLVSILNNSEETFSDLANYTDYLNRTFCTVTRSNLSIECSEEIYSNHKVWREKKDYINTAITELQRQLFELKGIRRYINKNRPSSNGKKLNNHNDENECYCQPMMMSVDDDYFNHQRENNTSDHIGRLRSRIFMYDDDHHHPHHHVDDSNHNDKPKHGTFNLKRWLRRRKKMRRRGKFENTACEVAASEQMNCFTHDNDHWKTPPLWTNGPFCFCQNSLNSSFWCMRTINETHNNLYCEFVTGFLSYYDLDKDPFQLRNLIFDLDFNVVEDLSRQLARLKSCSGSEDCSNPTKTKFL